MKIEPQASTKITFGTSPGISGDVQFRFRWKECGGHTHIRLFTGRLGSLTRAKCGDLVMSNEEFALFKTLHTSKHFEFIEDD